MLMDYMKHLLVTIQHIQNEKNSVIFFLIHDRVTNHWILIATMIGSNNANVVINV